MIFPKTPVARSCYAGILYYTNNITIPCNTNTILYYTVLFYINSMLHQFYIPIVYSIRIDYLPVQHYTNTIHTIYTIYAIHTIYLYYLHHLPILSILSILSIISYYIDFLCNIYCTNIYYTYFL